MNQNHKNFFFAVLPVTLPSLSPVSSRVEVAPSSVFAEYAKEYGSGAGCDASSPEELLEEPLALEIKKIQTDKHIIQ